MSTPPTGPSAWLDVAAEQYTDLALRALSIRRRAQVLDAFSWEGCAGVAALALGHQVTSACSSPAECGSVGVSVGGRVAARWSARAVAGRRLPFRSGAFDACVSILPNHAANEPWLCQELRRVVSPRGAVALCSWSDLLSVPLLAGAMSSLTPATLRRYFGPLSLAVNLEQTLRDSGFDSVRTERAHYTLEAPSIPLLWQDFAEHYPPFSLARGQDAWPLVSRQLSSAVVARFGDGPGRIEWIGAVVIGRASDR